jgi:diguanylate cyclase (GGDEF)-like protein
MSSMRTDLSIDCIEFQLAALRTELQDARSQLARRQLRLGTIAQPSSDWFRELDSTLRFVHCTGGRDGSDALAGLLLGRAPWELPATVPLSGERNDLHTQLESGRPFTDFVCVTRALGKGGDRFIPFAGEPVAGPQDRRAGWHGLAHDVTRTHRVHERLRQLAHRDRLTGLPNRAATESALQQLIDDSSTDGFRLQVLFVDLDGFKAVNDRLGHAAGDRVLQEAAHRLRSVLRDEDLLGRFGGDEFVVALAVRPAAGDLSSRTAARLREVMTLPFTVDGTVCRLGASIGVAVHPDHGHDLPTLLSHADAAMYEAKRARRSRAGTR